MPDISNPSVKAFQQALPSFGIVYSGRSDGIVDETFARAMRNLEELIQAKTGEPMVGKLFLGSGVGMSVNEVFKKYFPEQIKKIPNSIPDPAPPIMPDSTTTDVKPDDVSKAFKNLLSENLPVVGKLYNGDLEIAAKGLEAAISKEIHKSMSGIIWNDHKKSFNTTPDDIRKALNLLEKHNKNQPKTAKFTLDQRFLKMSQILLEYSNKK